MDVSPRDFVASDESKRRSVKDRDDQRVLSWSGWCALNNISTWTGHRLRKAGKGPVITQISDRRIGVTIANNRRWQQARERA